VNLTEVQRHSAIVDEIIEKTKLFLQTEYDALPLEFYLSSGGPLKIWLEQESPWAIHRRARFSTSLFGSGSKRLVGYEHAIIGDLTQRIHMDHSAAAGVSLILDESTDAIGSEKSHRLFSDLLTHQRFTLCHSDIEMQADLEPWLNFIFPKLKEFFDSREWLSLLKTLHCELPCAGKFPWLDLGYLPKFLPPHLPHSIVDQVALDWARMQAFLSPQDETQERASLAPGEVMINPTLQLICQGGQGNGQGQVKGHGKRQEQWPDQKLEFKEQYILIIARNPSYAAGYRESLLLQRCLNWMEAALIDHLMEEPRPQVQALLGVVEAEFRQQVSLPRLGEFSFHLEELIRAGFLVKGGC
jgi:hypothetical protein